MAVRKIKTPVTTIVHRMTIKEFCAHLEIPYGRGCAFLHVLRGLNEIKIVGFIRENSRGKASYLYEIPDEILLKLIKVHAEPEMTWVKRGRKSA